MQVIQRIEKNKENLVIGRKHPFNGEFIGWVSKKHSWGWAI